MDHESRERHGEPGVAPPAPHHEASLTGHVSQHLPPSLSSASISPSRHFSPPSSPSDLLPQHPSNFSFPTLNLDGSLPDLAPQPVRRYPPTPPAALSSLGAKARMANHTDSHSESELTDGQYDMIDDLSEISTDDHDTASIASNGDEGQLTPEDARSEVDPDESTLLLDRRPAHTPLSTAQSFVDIPAPMRDTVESYTSEDLETPRQSTMPIEQLLQQRDNGRLPATGLRNRKQRDGSQSPRPTCLEHASPEMSKLKTLMMTLSLLMLALPSILPTLMPWFWTHIGSKFEDPAARLAIRRASLVEALSGATSSSNVTKDFNIDHLISPAMVSCVSPDCKPSPHYQAVHPNHVVVSLPGEQSFPEVTKANVFKADGRRIDFNQSELIEGVHLVTFDPEEAYGIVTVNMLTRKPYLNVTAPHNFGNPLLQLKAYSKASTDVSKAVSKDVAVMRNAAKTLTEKLSSELGAGVWATKNITTQLALYVSRDLQVFSKSAVSFLGKAAKAGNHTASALSKDFVLVQRDAARFSKELSTLVKSRVAQAKDVSKALIRRPLATSRERLQGFKKALNQRKEKTRSSIKERVAKIKAKTSARKAYRKERKMARQAKKDKIKARRNKKN